MKNKIFARIDSFLMLLTILFFTSGFILKEKNLNSDKNLVETSTWYIAGPVIESQEIINIIRQKKSVVRVTAKDNPVGEIELNVAINASNSNDGIPVNLSNNSKFMSITYKSSHLIKIQAREGNEEGTGCVHGGSHPMVDLAPSPDKFTTIKILWSDFRQDGLPDGRLLNIHNLCKFNFVNYNPVSGAFLEIKSVMID
jgi:hypothetical protein